MLQGPSFLQRQTLTSRSGWNTFNPLPRAASSTGFRWFSSRPPVSTWSVHIDTHTYTNMFFFYSHVSNSCTRSCHVCYVDNIDLALVLLHRLSTDIANQPVTRGQRSQRINFIGSSHLWRRKKKPTAPLSLLPSTHPSTPRHLTAHLESTTLLTPCGEAIKNASFIYVPLIETTDLNY